MNERQADLRAGYAAALSSLQTGTYSGDGDIIDFSWYDSISLLSTVLNTRMFTIQVGQASPAGVIKNPADTNMVAAGQMPQGNKMYVNAIKMLYTSDEVRTEAEYIEIGKLFEQTVLNVKIQGKDTYGQWCLNEIMGNAFHGVIEPSTAGDNETPFGISRFHGIYPINLPIVLAAQTSFSIDLQHYTAPSANLDGDKIQISLSGILERIS